jgi:hypothetical protein
MTDEQILATAEATGVMLFGLGLDKEKFEFCLLAFAKQIVKYEREACALICERVYKRMCPEAKENEVGIEAEIIRSRGET